MTEDAWHRLWMVDQDALMKTIADEYVAEAWNLAVRARNKRQRSTEASSLFFASILFFGLATGLSIDVYRSIGNATGHEWSLALRLWLAGGIAAFLSATLYQRYRQSSGRNPDTDHLKGYKGLALAGAMLVMLLISTHGASLVIRLGAAVSGLMAAGIGGSCLATVLRSTAHRQRWRWAGVGVGSLSAVAILLERGAEQLLLAVMLGLSPLVGQVWRSRQETKELRKSRGGEPAAPNGVQ